MLNLTQTAIRLYRQIFGTPELTGQQADGIETVLDGYTAIAVTEACFTEVAALGNSFTEQGAALAWLSEQQRVNTNLFDQKLSVQQADSARGALASAIGVTLSGHRSTVFLNAQDMAACQDLLALAVGRRLPLVMHLDNRLLAVQGNSSGSGHEVFHQLLDSGVFVLFASNVQEAVDFTLIARHVAEITLTPAVVVIDGNETALSAQDVRLPSAELIKQFIGRADEKINSPTMAQKQLFSEQRNRLHQWFDLDNPVLQGMMLDPQIYALGSAAKKVYFDDLIEKTLENAFSHYTKLTGRKYSALSTYALKKADIIIVAQGSAIETVKTLSDVLSTHKLNIDKIKVGVIGLHSLRPFNSTQLIDLLSKNKCTSGQVVVLERMDVPLADDGALMREIRAAIQKKNVPDSLPELHSIIYGLGGADLNLADLHTLCREIKSNKLQGRYLGIAFNTELLNTDKTKEQHPKRQVLMDTLLRYYPQISHLGINAADKKLPLFADKSKDSKIHNSFLSIAVSYPNKEDADTAYAMELAGFLHKLNGHYLRSFISPSWQQWSTRQTDYVIQSDKPCDTGCSSLVNFCIVLSADAKSILSACQRLNKNGHLLFTDNGQFDKLINSRDGRQNWADCLTLIDNNNLTLYRINASVSDCFENVDEAVSIQKIQWEKILGLLVGLLQSADKLNIKTRKIVSIRQSFLNHFSTEFSQQTQDMLGVFFKQTMENIKTFDSHSVLKDNQLNGLSDSRKSFKIIPEMVEKFGQADGSSNNDYDSLPRFWDQVGVLQQAGELKQLTADPYLASGTLPSLTAAFNNISKHRTSSTIPVFNAQDCTACGACWVNCPDSAIAVVALTPKVLIETAIRSTGADALRQVTSKLASQIAKRLRLAVQNEDIGISTAGNLLNDAMYWLKEKSGLPQERLQSIQADFEKAYPAIAELSISVTNLLFTSQENKENGSGELFSLVINPESCKTCGLCVELCEPGALQTPVNENAQADNRITNYSQQWNIWQRTPDTLSATIERLINEKSMHTGAALMLSRHNAFALSGGDHGEPASGEKIAMRQLLSAVEYHQQPLLFRFISELEHLRDGLKQEINASLSEALPTDNLSLLAEKLSDVKNRQIDLNALLENHSQVMDSAAIDAVKIREYVNYVLQINELHWKLSQGTYGLGRARYSLCITSSSIASWAGTFPYNPFHVPVNIDISGESAQIAAGLVQGQVNDLLSVISLKRKAKASIGTRSVAKSTKQTEILDQLQWSDLTDEEQQICPPLLLVGGDDLLGGQGFSQVSSLLNGSYPVKIVVFSELDSGLVGDGLHELKLTNHYDSRNNLAMMAMSQRNAYVAQTSIADNSHLQQSVHDLLNISSPGLLRIHTPSPLRHGFEPQFCIRQAQLAVTTRMFPLFSYNPQKEGIFGSRLSLQGNSDIEQDWVKDEDNKVLTPIDWAINESRFQAHFSPLAANAPSPVEFLDWLNLSELEQIKKTPFIIKEEEKIAVSNDFAKMVINQQQSWRTLQELAGIVTPFTDYVEKCVEQRLEAEHQAELDSLRVEYEAKLAQLEENYNSQTHTKIRDQLLGLAGYDAGNL
jgi:pyruvate-ferredoxin/flavodoxin oxidoreductase